MADWHKQAAIHIVVGYQMNMMVTLLYGGWPSNVALFVLSFLCYTAAIITLAVEKIKATCNNLITGILIAVFLVLSVILTIVSLIIWGAAVPTYQGALAVLSSFLALVGASFRLIKMINKYKTSPSDSID